MDPTKTNKQNHEYLKSQFDIIENGVNFYSVLLDYLLKNNVSLEFLEYIAERELFMESPDTKILVLQTKNINIIKYLMEHNVLKFKIIRRTYFGISLKMVKFLYENGAKFDKHINYFQMQFSTNFTEKKRLKIRDWFSNINYRSGCPIEADGITDELLQFCIAKNTSLSYKSIAAAFNKDRSVIDLLNKHNFRNYDKKMLVLMCPYAFTSLEDKIKLIKEQKMEAKELLKDILDSNDVESFEMLYEACPVNVNYNYHFVVDSNNVEMMQVMIKRGQSLFYACRKTFKIFEDRNFDLWKKLHNDKIISWCQAELEIIKKIPDHRFIKYAILCGDEAMRSL